MKSKPTSPVLHLLKVISATLKRVSCDMFNTQNNNNPVSQPALMCNTLGIKSIGIS